MTIVIFFGFNNMFLVNDKSDCLYVSILFDISTGIKVTKVKIVISFMFDLCDSLNFILFVYLIHVFACMFHL